LLVQDIQVREIPFCECWSQLSASPAKLRECQRRFPVTIKYGYGS
jgi:hypothetical protein